VLVALLLASLPAGHSHVRLLDGGAQLQRVDDEGPTVPSLEGMTHEQLQREWDRLDADRPSFSGPIAMAAGGGGVAIVGLVLLIYGISFEAVSATGAGISPAVGITLIVIGLVALAAGITFAVFGGLRIRDAVYDRRLYGDQMRKVKDLLEGGPPMPFDQPHGPPPNVPPPPPVPSSVLFTW
jgi:hypothetical protein